MSLPSPSASAVSAALDVICLCAEWCGTCRDYQPLFEALAARHPEARFGWIDIEDEADRIGELDIENFPTILIARSVNDRLEPVFFGTVLPHIELLARQIQEAGVMAPLGPGGAHGLNDAELASLRSLVADL